MPKYYSSKYIIDILLKNNFEFVSQKGSHAKYKKGKHIVIVPTPRKEIPAGTFSSIVRQAGLLKSDFEK